MADYRYTTLVLHNGLVESAVSYHEYELAETGMRGEMDDPDIESAMIFDAYTGEIVKRVTRDELEG